MFCVNWKVYKNRLPTRKLYIFFSSYVFRKAKKKQSLKVPINVLYRSLVNGSAHTARAFVSMMTVYGRVHVQSNCNVKVRDFTLLSSNPYQTTHIILYEVRNSYYTYKHIST